MFASELVKPIEEYLRNIKDCVGVNWHNYQLCSVESDEAFRPKYEVLPYEPNSLDKQPVSSNILSLQYVNVLGKQYSGEADAYNHLFRLISISGNMENCQNNRDYAATVIQKGVADNSIEWANYSSTGGFCFITRVAPTRDSRNNYICSTSFAINLGGKGGDCSC